MKKKTLRLETIHQCNCCLGCKTLHPLVSAIDLSKASLTEDSVKFDFYTVLLIENEYDDFRYGREHYDYSDATLIFLSPGESIQMDEGENFPQKGWLLAFHPHLICGTTLGMNIDNYTFFSYGMNEALHLSLREKTKAAECLACIGQELQHAVDRHSRTLISRYIELLLDYCTRFYERQFILRSDVNKQLLCKLDVLLDEYTLSGKLRSAGLPTNEHCSRFLCLSPCYFGDLLKHETGKTISEYLQLKRMEAARRLLLDTDMEVDRIAGQLGFPNAACFSKLFLKLTGKLPEEYRLVRN